MPVKIFKFLQNKLVDITDSLGLSKTNGLYNNLHSEDLDGDGYIDLVLGNGKRWDEFIWYRFRKVIWTFFF